MSLSVNDDPAQRELNLAPTKLSELAEGVLAILAGRCRHAKIAVAKEFPPNEPAIPADAGQLRQVMMNLMVNAIQAMPTGGTMTVRVCSTGILPVCSMGILPMSSQFPAVSVSSSSSAAPERQQQQQQEQQQQDMARMAMLHKDMGKMPMLHRIRFQVADTGKGVAERDRDIFEAFVSDKPNGVGLGLYLCKQIVTRHGGKIGFDSSDKGATFWVELPLANNKKTSRELRELRENNGQRDK